MFIVFRVFRRIVIQIIPTISGRVTTQRILVVGIVVRKISSGFDSEESWALTSTRAGLADYPCPNMFEPQTIEGMMQGYHNPIECQTKSGLERILQQNRLHRTFDFFWSLPHLDPYLASSYNKLHADDLGKFGKHLWWLLLSILEDLNYADGMAYFDILRVHRIQRLRGYIKTYMDYYFLKQHLTTHDILDIRQKGTLDNYETRVGENFHQEVQEAYKQTNCKDTKPQMARIDGNLEAVAHIHMLIDNTTRSDKVQSGSNATQICGTLARSNDHWILGSPAARITDAKGLADELIALSEHLVQFSEEEYLTGLCGGQPSSVFQCLYLTYQSLEDWREGQDILRCNPDFHIQLHMLFRCITSRSPVDIALALVHSYKQTSWKPKTVWEGMHVFEQAQKFHMVKVFGMKDGHEYLNDTIDGDMFLRAGN
ncbi:hypothetical protein C8R48DRAFT_751177 [Suillus tomentosus]|nr:hypothetical protein C8R48DRAFT_751177 [Suillus tomentosus]